ncbi:MAG: 30S ribosomal protein S9 [Proteobacteria bacterium]|nr:30S ribosomal protein S9 [Pseudomonadota bacterium]
MSETIYYATGKRKTSIARTWIKPGTGQVTVNGRDIDEFFTIETAKMVLRQPMELTGTLGQIDVMVNVAGGGVSGQAGAIKHGISKALVELDPQYRGVLKKAGFLTRDARKKERKKYGQRGARARFQFSKR